MGQRSPRNRSKSTYPQRKSFWSMRKTPLHRPHLAHPDCFSGTSSSDHIADQFDCFLVSPNRAVAPQVREPRETQRLPECGRCMPKSHQVLQTLKALNCWKQPQKAQSFNRKGLGPKNRNGAEAPKASTPAALKSLHLSSVVLRLMIGGLGVYRV